jgi:hypothetical protein
VEVYGLSRGGDGGVRAAFRKRVVDPLLKHVNSIAVVTFLPPCGQREGRGGRKGPAPVACKHTWSRQVNADMFFASVWLASEPGTLTSTAEVRARS